MSDQPILNFMYRDVLTGEADTPLAEVIAQMNARGQSEFIVCESECPVGVISERDAISILNQALRGSDFAKVRAADVMVSPVQTLCETSMMSEVIGMMRERRFRRVPITNDKNELVGVVNLQDVQNALNTTLEQRGRDLEVAVMERTAELLEANQKLEELSIRDGLTGLLNRRAMTEKLVELHTRTQRYGNSYSMVLMDIDHFKNYNDSLGHVQGDEALRTISKLIVDAVRTLDLVYRYGGEEFLIAMPETGSGNVHLAAERIRAHVEHAALPHPQSTAGNVVTLSVGYAVVTLENIQDFESWEKVVVKADSALYRAKQAGRNRVEGS